MQIPFPMLKIAGGGKVAAVLALLAGLYMVTAMRQAQRKGPMPPGM